MATDLENAKARRSQILAELAAITLNQPDQSIDGESMSHAGNRAQLQQELKDLQVLIQQLGGPYRIRSRGRA